MKAALVLEDGSTFQGVSIGAAGERMGEVILQTAVVGYQEIATDPANAGKIVVLTYPLIGNYGTAKKFYESKRAWPEGIIIKEKSRLYSNWQAKDSFDNFLKKEKLAVLSEVDTRTLAVKIRDDGQMPGIISVKGTKISTLLKKLKDYKKTARNDFMKKISVKKITKFKGSPGPKIAILDLGITNGFLKQLRSLGCNITLVPFNAAEDAILRLNTDGLVISNGPEDDTAIPGIVETVKNIIGKIPILGISTGHQILWRALGGELKKMKLGHHGVNYPVRPPTSYKGEITVQNHSFIVDEDSIKDKKDIEITLRNVNDNSVEEMESKRLKFISTQYYPVSPGFEEINNVFRRFLEMAGKKNTKKDPVCQSVKI